MMKRLLLLSTVLMLTALCIEQADSRARRGTPDCATLPCRNGGTCTMNVAAGTYTCQCGFGFQGTNCEIACGQLDVVLILDESGSIGLNNWQKSVVPFAVSLASKLPIDPDLVRLGCVRFHTKAEIFFYINEEGLRDSDAVEAKMQSLDSLYQEGWTNTSGGLYYAREYLFIDDEVHDRAAVHDLIILFTDGPSNKAVPGSDAISQGNLNHAACIETYVVAVGNSLNDTEVEAIATNPGPDSDHIIRVPDLTRLTSTVDRLVTSTCEVSAKTDLDTSTVSPESQLHGPCIYGTTCTSSRDSFTCHCMLGPTEAKCYPGVRAIFLPLPIRKLRQGRLPAVL